MNRKLATVMTLGAMLATGSANAGEVNMPKEGSYECRLIRKCVGWIRGCLRRALPK
jgi:hypothetical protein